MRSMLFTDGSVNTQSKVGYGAALWINEEQQQDPLEELSSKVETVRFESTSSTRLELQTLLWALNKISLKNVELSIYTDSQNIIGLPSRRLRLEQNNYFSKQKKRIKNHDLYREFYQVTDTFSCQFIKVDGHLPVAQRDGIDTLFALVDRASRRALRMSKVMY